MNNQDREPSMDEILASIRQIIAEEPSEARADGEGAANPLLTGTELRASNPFQHDDRPRPSADRLSNAIRARAAAPPPPPPAARRAEPFAIGAPQAIDDDNDLSDLLDEPPASSVFGILSSGNRPAERATNGKAPSISFPTGYLNGSAAKAESEDFSPLAQGEEPQNLALNGIEVRARESTLDIIMDLEQPAIAPEDGSNPEIVTEQPKLAAASEPAASTPPAPAQPIASPFDSMRRKNGFWPPQNGAKSPSPSPATAAASANGSAFPGSGPWPAPDAHRPSFSAPPSANADLVARLRDGLSGQPPEPETPPAPETPPMQFAAPLGSGGSAAVPPLMNGATYASAPPAPAGYNASQYSAPRAPEPVPVASTPAAPTHDPYARPQDPYARPMSTDALMEAALAALTGSAASPSPARDAYGRPLNGEARPHYSDAYAQSYASPRPDPAAAALDALAQGLAAPPRTEPARRGYDNYQPAQSYSHNALVAQPLVPAVQDYHPQAIRTLEDAVADMLKPMLQKWLADNMPRIIERALRVEAASGMKQSGPQ